MNSNNKDPDTPTLVTVANHLLQKMATRRMEGISVASIPYVNSCQTYKDGNFTFVVVETHDGQEFTGTAKFNPADLKCIKNKRSDGRQRIRYQSKFSPRAGELKALHRALEKILE